MEKYEKQFSILLEQEKKQQAYEFALELLQNGTINVIELYSDVLTPSLNHMQCSLQDKKMCVWKEHVRTAIVRTIVESCYPFVVITSYSIHYTKLYDCIGSSCHLKGSRQVVEKLQELIEKNNLKEKIDLSGTFCMGNCQRNNFV